MVTRSFLDQPPEAVRWPVRRTFREDDRRAHGTGADHRPRPHDPAHVRREQRRDRRAEVRLVGRLARSRAGSRRGRAVRPSAARWRPDVYASRYGCSASSSTAGSAPAFPRRRPPSGHPVRLSTDSRRPTGPDQNVLDGRRLPERLVGDLLHRDQPAAAGRGVRRDQQPGTGVRQARADRRRREPEKIGTWIAPTSARVRRDGRRAIGRNVATASPADAEPTSASARRRTSYESSAHVSVRPLPSSAPRPRPPRRGARLPSGGRRPRRR